MRSRAPSVEMLSLGKIAAGPQAASYYTDQVARGREDYYAGEGEPPGYRIGAGAVSLGLAAEVDADTFSRLLDGAGLRKPPSSGAVAGFDLTFRAPKSVSVLWAVAGPGVALELRAGHDTAVAAVLGYLEREACRARRGAGGHIEVRGGGFVGAAFAHRASRAGDPLLHTHVVVGNLTQGPDGRWTALDARHLYRQAKTAGYLYQAELRRELAQRLGLEWGAVERGVADVRGVSRSVVEHFSRRRAQILEHMAEHGGRSARSAQVAALETRRAKHELPVERVRELWRARAAEHGLDADAVAALLDRGRGIVRPAREVGLRRLTEQASTFGRTELLQALAEAQPSGATVAELELLADLALSRGEVVSLADGGATAGVVERRFTTSEMLAIERELIAHAKSRRHAFAGVARSDAIGRALAARGLSREQRGVVRAVCKRGHGVTVVRAAAGTGKTFALDAAREAWEASRIDVVGCALSARAALELSDQSGIRSLTIASLRRRLDRGEALPSGCVLVVDEAGMVGTRAIAALAEAVDRAEGKLVLVGDDRQLPEIEAGGAFHALAGRLGAHELHEVRRQHEAWDREALEALRNGEVERWARAYRDRGRITVANVAADVRAALVNDWFRADGDKLMVAARRDDVRDLNERARELVRSSGGLGREELEVAGRAFAVGERVVGRRNDRGLGILNGQRGRVREIDHGRRNVEVELDAGVCVRLSADYLEAGHLDHGYAVTAHRAQGATVDRVFVLGSDELYREWGYTALSRHREEARFYVTRGDLGLRRDHPPEPDPVIAGLARLLGRSRAKELALDGLAEAAEEDLRRERHDRGIVLRTDPLPRPESGRLAQELDRTHAALEAARQHEAELRERQEGLRWFDRRGRAEVRKSLAIAGDRVDLLAGRCQQARTAHAVARDRELGWLLAHAEDADRLLAVDRELRVRERLDRDVTRRLGGLQHATDPLERAVETPSRGLGLDLDMGR